MADLDAVEHDVRMLREIITRLGTPQEDGSIDVTYGVLFEDDDCQQTVRPGCNALVLHCVESTEKRKKWKI